jgi:two-component system, chemotaxis family, chemotaxis protein CheY
MANILVVDDSPTLRRVLCSTLIAAGHQVVEAGHGGEGLEAMKHKMFNLIISDLSMPIMDGLTFIGKVRVLGAYKHTPILVLTTEMDPEKMKKAKELGATGWMVKPFEAEQLVAAVRKVLDRKIA